MKTMTYRPPFRSEIGAYPITIQYIQSVTRESGARLPFVGTVLPFDR